MTATTASEPVNPTQEDTRQWPALAAAFGHWKPEAVVFDWDGLLMNTEASWSLAKRRVFARRGLTMGSEHVEMTYGLYPGRSAEVLAPFLSAEPSVIAEELVQFALQNISKGVNAMAGAETALELAAARAKIAVASNSPRVVLDAGLRRSGFNRFFSATVAADEVDAPKPRPDVYNAARRVLSAAAVNTLVFEDSATGITAARAAGLRVIAVSARNQLPLIEDGHTFGAHLQFSSFTDPQLQAWIRSWHTNP
jgi:HAD superfamily hydrolase (TIGR01509 family)